MTRSARLSPATTLPASPFLNPQRTLVLVAHPRLGQSRITRRLADAARAAASAEGPDWAGSTGPSTATSATAPATAAGLGAGPEQAWTAQGQAPGQAQVQVQVRDLYALYPDQFIDAEAERAALAGVQRLVWLHPWHWYGMTPLLKQWLDEVFTAGWAFGPGGRALAGMELWLVTSTGGSAQSYHPGGEHDHEFEAFLPAYRQTAALCGMRFLPPLVLHQAAQVGEAELQAHARRFVKGLMAR